MHHPSLRNSESGIGWAVRASLIQSLPRMWSCAAILEAPRYHLRPPCALWTQHWCLLSSPLGESVPLCAWYWCLFSGSRDHYGRLRPQHFLVRRPNKLPLFVGHIHCSDISRQCLQSCDLQQLGSYCRQWRSVCGLHWSSALLLSQPACNRRQQSCLHQLSDASRQRQHADLWCSRLPRAAVHHLPRPLYAFAQPCSSSCRRRCSS